MPAVGTESPFSRPLNKILSATLTNSAGHCATEATKGALGGEDASIEGNVSVFLERSQMATSLSYGNQRLSEMEK